jgi:uncharacterized membrane protein
MADQSAPSWARWSSFGLSLGGLAVSVYLTVEHATAARTLACPETGVVNCATVLSSPQSVVLGIPVAVLGLAYFVVMAVLTTPPMWRRDGPPGRSQDGPPVWRRWAPGSRGGGPLLDRVRVGLAAVGVLSVLYLVFVELFVVDAICLWCTVVHILTVALFAVLVMDLAGRPEPAGQPRPKDQARSKTQPRPLARPRD